MKQSLKNKLQIAGSVLTGLALSAAVITPIAVLESKSTNFMGRKLTIYEACYNFETDAKWLKYGVLNNNYLYTTFTNYEQLDMENSTVQVGDSCLYKLSLFDKGNGRFEIPESYLIDDTLIISLWGK